MGINAPYISLYAIGLMDHIHYYFTRHKICNFMPVHGGLELSVLINFICIRQ